jgi:ATP-dependent Lhr-like helicase
MVALAGVVRAGGLGRITVERADGQHIWAGGEHADVLRQALEKAGFVATPRGLRLRA